MLLDLTWPPDPMQLNPTTNSLGPDYLTESNNIESNSTARPNAIGSGWA